VRSTPPELGAHNAAVKRLRALLRDRAARRDERHFVAEGPRVVDLAIEHAAAGVEMVYVGSDATRDAQAVADRATAAGIETVLLAPGVGARVSDTRHAQGVFALARMPDVDFGTITAPGRASLVVVAELIGDPGNAGTLIRSAAAAGADAVILGAGSVDAYNPKVVRASAGACFTIPIVEDVPPVQALPEFAADWQRIGAVAAGGREPESFDLARPTVIVLGHETRGLGADFVLDGQVTIPIHAGESLNLAMAGTALLFEAARQRRARA
jgi:TrmH family RNA methyltransferase